jgi:hypothetical protein
MTATQAGRRNTRSFRAWDGTWEDLAKTGRDENFAPATLLSDTADVLAGYIRCARCGGTPVPVQFGNLAGRPLWEWIGEAERAVRFQKCKDHQPVRIGAAPDDPVRHLQQDIPGLVPASELAAPAGSAVFQTAGGSRVVAAPAPAATTDKRRKKARCAHVVAAGTRCKICEPRP